MCGREREREREKKKREREGRERETENLASTLSWFQLEECCSSLQLL